MISGYWLKKILRSYRTELPMVILAALLFWVMLPGELFRDPYSTVVYDRQDRLAGARIAEDGQWRFPEPDTIPGKYEKALLVFEDQYYYSHPGINPLSLIRAAIHNLRRGEIVSGGSTITMQVVRMSRKQKPRTLWQKLIEMMLALRYELTHSKSEILTTYAGHAPFGGNVVGLDAAAWRYFGRAPGHMTWSEAALLAVLPNAPSLIHPGKNRELLLNKRNRLLDRLASRAIIDSITCHLAKLESLPDEPRPLPDKVPHITDRIMLDKEVITLHSTIDGALQDRVLEMVENQHKRLEANQIHNLACMVMDVETGEVLAYAGNTEDRSGNRLHGNDVDVIRASRSTGSILKPLLFAGLMEDGLLLPTSLVPDVPVRYQGYAPKNYNRSYEGAVPAYKALERSLNVPSVIMLKRYGVEPFLQLLRDLGFTTFTKSHMHYGLTLILGGAEAKLWELTGVYGSLARVLNHYNRSHGTYFPSDYHMPVLNSQATLPGRRKKHEEGLLSAGSIYLMLESLLEVNRPEELSLWYLMSSSRNIAWKTGTSYGYRDAWAIGVTPGYVVGVWAGNSDGEGRPGLTGLTAAAPLMFDVFSLLPPTNWFEAPTDDLSPAVVCQESGFLAGPFCQETDTVWVVPRGQKSGVCPYHRKVHLSEDGMYRVTASCYPVRKMETRSWFVLPPLMEWYYKRAHPSYRELPSMMQGCVEKSGDMMEIVYPEPGSHIVIPRELSGERGKVVLEVAHREEESVVHWHIDEVYQGTTRGMHQLAVDLASGAHTLTVIDGNGEEKRVRFEILGRR